MELKKLHNLIALLLIVFFLFFLPYIDLIILAIEAQLEAEHEERTGLVREKHELERRLLELTSELSQSTNDVVVHKLKKELRKLKALLKDAQVQLEQAKSDTPSKVLLRQLRNQVSVFSFFFSIVALFSVKYFVLFFPTARSLWFCADPRVAFAFNLLW